MSKLTAMLKWAMRIIAVSGTLLAMAIGTAAWMHRTRGREWRVTTPMVFSTIAISPQDVRVSAWLRREWDPTRGEAVPASRYRVTTVDWDNLDTKDSFRDWLKDADVGKLWHGLGGCRGNRFFTNVPSFTAILFPTWLAMALLVLPMGLWSGIALRQRRRAVAGHCVNCGYDLRASPERCPECGRDVKKR